ncbi:maleylpyruvate isomerase N-terminal domain-containing protein [Nocardia sp. NPDC060249]|uniref:maleylpyruvate isomerase N-terminal domain-containing protein n=1 Tax=Nocardia sp. NPDC060249 TaxID=3347082 RepID=UPI00365B6FA4
MTAIEQAAVSPRRARLTHTDAMRFAREEYVRFADAVASLDDGDWTTPTECTGWTVHDLVVDVVGITRDPWIDLARATGHTLVLTEEHDGAIVAGVVEEWAARHGRPYNLRLRGAAGGRWHCGTTDERLDLDAVEFCRILSGRAESTGLLITHVPF